MGQSVRAALVVVAVAWITIRVGSETDAQPSSAAPSTQIATTPSASSRR